jgi:hypothetical protein
VGFLCGVLSARSLEGETGEDCFYALCGFGGTGGDIHERRCVLRMSGERRDRWIVWEIVCWLISIQTLESSSTIARTTF